MKVKVLKHFRDRQEDVIRNPGEIFTVTKKRFSEIDKGLPGYVKEVVEDEKKTTDD